MLRTTTLLFLLAVVAVDPRGALAASPENSAAGLERIYEREWQRWLQEDPITATFVGDDRYNGLWPDQSPAAIQRSHTADLAAARELAEFDATHLAPADRLNYDIVTGEFKRRIDAFAFKPYLYPISHKDGIRTASEWAEIAPFKAEKDFDDWIARLRSFGVFMDQTIALMRTAIADKRTQPRVIMDRVIAQIAAQRVASPEASPFYEPFKTMPTTLAEPAQRRLRAQAAAAIRDSVLPAFARFEHFFKEQYLPSCRSSVGISDTPDGANYYRERIAYHTTTALSATEIHAIGLAEVKRIRAEMDQVITQVGFKGDFQAFSQFLRTDPQFVYKDPGELFRAYQVIAKSIDPNLTKLFGKLPRTPYGVRAIPMTSAPNTTTAYYQPLASDGSRPGYFYVNLYKPEARPKWEMEVLTSHEAVPGHHLQIALQYEEGAHLPMIRRMADYTAYVEGWGLYSESLGYDLGLYTDPYSHFGQLTYDMWRAVRLVVDTGVHAQGWSRQQAIDYFKANAPKSELDITNEIDRYIATPGQALAYKIGQMKILALRAEAEKALGPRFDIRQFHDVLLSTGAVPLSIMEKTVRDWISVRGSGAR